METEFKSSNPVVVQPADGASQPVTNPAPEKPKRKFHVPKIAILIVFFILLLFLMQGGLYLAKKSDNNSSLLPSPVPISQISLTPDPTKDWETFTSSVGAYSIKHPSDWTTLQNETLVRLFPPGITIENGLGPDKPTTFISISVTDLNPEDCRGGCPTIDTKSDQILENKSITRLSGIVGAVGGNTPHQYESIIFRNGTSYIIISIENDNMNPITEQNILIFDQIAASLNFTNSSVSNPPSTSNSSPADPGQTEPAQPIMVACTMEAKICPDGVTSVGRSGPKCEFEKCPSE